MLCFKCSYLSSGLALNGRYGHICLNGPSWIAAAPCSFTDEASMEQNAWDGVKFMRLGLLVGFPSEATSVR